MPFIIITLTLLTAALIFGIRRHRFLTRRRQLLARELPPQQLEILRTALPLYNRLPDPLPRQLQGLVNAFLHEKQFEGCGGLQITDTIKISIAAQACLLLLNRPATLFPKLKTILVYPHTFFDNQRPDGSTPRLGESWQNGPVVLAWDSVRNGAAIINDGHNVVLHEFAHQLDQEDGAADGAPILDTRARYQPWAQILSREFLTLQKKARSNRKSVLDHYGAVNPAEFFAVATETFFEKPTQLAARHPELYRELQTCYRLDPASWNLTP